MINTASYSFAAQAYSDNVEKVISVMEGIVGIGCAAGPILGSVIYESVGFEKTFQIFGTAMAPTCLLVCFLKDPK